MPVLRNLFTDNAIELGISTDEIGVYIQPVVQNHACHVEFMLPFHPENLQQVVLPTRFEGQVTQRLMQAGAFFSRPYGAASELACAQNLAKLTSSGK